MTTDLALKIRRHAVKMTSQGGSSHVGSVLSIADILAVLYGAVLRIDPARPSWPDRDRFILSKGHAGAGAYAALAERGFFPVSRLATHYQDGSDLSGHVSHKGIPGVEISTGSLGHGLSIGCGMAYAAKLDSKRHRVFVLLSDGECDEGSNWEAILFAAHHQLDNLVVIIDYNKLQSLTSVDNTLKLEPFEDKWRSFGWNTLQVDGHNHPKLLAALDTVPFAAGQPSCLIAHTTKGKGVSFMENQVLWHYRTPRGEELAAALRELGGEVKEAFIRRLTALAEKDPRLMLVVGDLGFGMVEGFVGKCPRQYLNVGVAEQNMTGVATGLALEGKIVFTYSIANFATLRCLEQIRNDAAYHDANVKVVAMGGGFSYGALGVSHHATEDLAIMRALPTLTVVAPGDDWEAEEAVEALANRPGTCYLRLDKSTAGNTRRPGEKFTVGKARRVREGTDLTLIAAGGILGSCLAVADTLARQGLQARVISMHTLKPLDTEAVLAAGRETGGIFTVEEHTVEGGLGGAVAETLLEAGVYPPVFRRIGLRAGFSSVVGSQAFLRSHYGLDEKAIIAVLKDGLKI